MEYGKPKGDDERPPSPPKEVAKPNFERSGKLAAETNTFRGVVLKYHEPPEARKPAKTWRLYVFKDKEQVGAQCLLCARLCVLN
jgi:smad nuclear-interacting protein 1